MFADRIVADDAFAIDWCQWLVMIETFVARQDKGRDEFSKGDRASDEQGKRTKPNQIGVVDVDNE